MTVSDVISLTSEHADAEDVFKERRRELDMMAEQELVFDTDPAQVDMKGSVQSESPIEEGTDSPEAVEPDEAELSDNGS